MADKFKKIDKEFQLTDSSVNCYGFRLMTSGYQQSEFEKNPIGYYMHERYSGVLLKWEDFRIEDDKVFAKPVINLNHYRAEQTVAEIEDGFLNGASVGHIVVLELTDDPIFKLSGQDGPTVTKWFNRECSIVDIPGNFASLSLFDADENPLNLADFSTTSNTKFLQKMKQVFLSAEQLGKLNLKADVADQASVDVALNDLIAKAQQVEGLTQQLLAANTAKTTAETALADFKKEANTGKLTKILADALAAGKVTKDGSEKLKAKYAEDAEGLEDLVSAMPAYASITSQIKNADEKTGAKNLASMSWSELHKGNLLETYKAQDLAGFKAKYSEAHDGKEYKD